MPLGILTKSRLLCPQLSLEEVWKEKGGILFATLTGDGSANWLSQCRFFLKDDNLCEIMASFISSELC